jgi:hypothetical protein
MPTDILLDISGDILINDKADISLKYSIRQAVKIRLQWFFEEWRFAPELGLPYFEEVFVKNPIIERLRQIIREESMKADGVREVRDIFIDIDNKTRNAFINFVLVTEYGLYSEEVTINV